MCLSTPEDATKAVTEMHLKALREWPAVQRQKDGSRLIDFQQFGGLRPEDFLYTVHTYRLVSIAFESETS